MTKNPASQVNSETDSQDKQEDNFYTAWFLLVITSFLILTGIALYGLYVCAVSDEIEAKIVKVETPNNSRLNFLATPEYQAVYQYDSREFTQPVSLGIGSRRILEKGEWPILVKRSSPDKINTGSKAFYYQISIFSFVTAIISLVLFIVFSRQDLKRTESSQES
jgi:hypothetical protein